MSDTKTKRVDGEDLEKSAFAYQGSEKTADWKLPIKFSTDAKTKSHIRNAIARWSSTDMPDAAEKSKARERIRAAAKEHDIDIEDGSLARAQGANMNAVRRLFQAAKKATVLELYIYDSIGVDFWTGGGVVASDVAAAIKDAGDYDSILLRINSPGGDVFEGSAIHTLLRSQGKPVNVIVDGLAASAAFTIAMAGDNIEVGEAAMMMLHNGWAMAVGEAKDLRQTADLLDKICDTMAGVYAKRSGQTIEAVHAMMDAETWLSGDEAVAKGFANGVLATSKEDAAAAKALASQMLAASKTVKFAHVPDTLKAQEAAQKPAEASVATGADESAPSDGEPAAAVSVPMCECDCGPCMANNCAGCDDPSCDGDACMCATSGSDEGMSVSPNIAARLRLAEHSAFLATI